tara:strand:+ start:2001 stop:2198 length:198 start_codon:yes stop_codon:yes gene_type:complete
MIKLSMNQNLVVRKYLLAGASYQEASEAANCSISTAARVARKLKTQLSVELQYIKSIEAVIEVAV